MYYIINKINYYSFFLIINILPYYKIFLNNIPNIPPIDDDVVRIKKYIILKLNIDVDRNTINFINK